MKKPLFIFIFGILLVTTFSFISAEDWGYNYLEGDLNTAQAINYSQLNVNNSQFLRGYSPLTLGSWLESSFGWIDNSVNDLENYFTKTQSDDRYINVDGDSMEGNLSINGNVTAKTSFFDYIGSLINKTAFLPIKKI